MMRGKLILATIAIGLFSSLAAFAAGDHDHMSHTMMMMKPAEPLPGMSIYNLTSSWTNQDGKQVTLGSLRGEPVVIAMGYTSCKDICPMIVADMVAIENHAKSIFPEKVHYAFFSLIRRRYAGAPDGLRKRPRARSRRLGSLQWRRQGGAGARRRAPACATAVTLAAVSTIRPSLPFSMPMGGSWRSNPTSPPTPRQW